MKDYEKIIDFSKFTSWSSEVMKAEGQKILDKIFDSDNETKIAVKISKVGSGYSESCIIDIYNSVIDASETLNNHEYIYRESVEVFEITKKGYMHLFYKTFDGTNYSRLAQPKFAEYNLSIIRDLFDSEVVIYVSL